MQLTVLERILLLNALPKEGDYTTIKIVRKLRESLSFNEEEHAQLNLKFEDGRVTWEKELDKDVHIGAKAKSIAEKAMKELDSRGKLNEESLSLYEKFCGAADEE